MGQGQSDNAEHAGEREPQPTVTTPGGSVTCGDSIARHRLGFTLLELLAVLAIVSFLVAILLPVHHLARKNARLLSCGSNLKQLALAWGIYLDDHEGRFYQGINANVNYGGWMGIRGWWPRPLNRYLGFTDSNDVGERNARVFCCPSDRGGIPGAFLRERAYRVLGTSYQTNIFLIGQDSCGAFSEHTQELDLAIAARLPDLRRSRVTANPSRLLLMGDYGWINQWKPLPHPYPEWKELAEWHGKADGHSMAFLDGHVGYTTIRKGYYVTSSYCVLPFAELFSLAMEVQGLAE
jgi:prepilin-type N-terminal cleavage/methylation domain-containing protein